MVFLENPFEFLLCIKLLSIQSRSLFSYPVKSKVFPKMRINSVRSNSYQFQNVVDWPIWRRSIGNRVLKMNFSNLRIEEDYFEIEVSVNAKYLK